MINKFITPNNYWLGIFEQEDNERYSDSETVVSSILSQVEDDMTALNDTHFRLSLFEVCIKLVPNFYDLLMVNDDNRQLTKNQREFLSDLYRIANGELPTLSIPMRINIIKDEREDVTAKDAHPFKIADELLALDGVKQWFNVINYLSTNDILCVIIELFDNQS